MSVNLPKIRIFVEHHLLNRARNGRHNFLNLVGEVLDDNFFEVSFHLNAADVRQRLAPESNFALFHKSPPYYPNALCFRPVYFAPFWQIEATEKRWDWQIAKARFAPDDVEWDLAEKFYAYWRKRLFGKTAAQREDKGFVYMPLQGRLLAHRSFQFCAPIEMVETSIAIADRPIKITLHPNEAYRGNEMAALDQVVDAHDHISIVKTEPAELLRTCSYVVTQNSSLAFHAMFFAKPSILFGDIDFRHATLSVPEFGLENCFEQITDFNPDYVRYIYWFLQKNAINAGHPSAKAKIAQALSRHGWPIKEADASSDTRYLC